MSFLYFVMLYFFYFFTVLLIHYYATLLNSKNEYTRDELLNIFPPVMALAGKILNSFSTGMVIAIIMASSLVGIIITLVTHWLFQSAIPLALAFLLFPVLARYFDERKVTTSENYRDMIANVFAAKYDLLTLGLGLGLGTGCMFWWAMGEGVSFLWLVLNLIVITAFLSVAIRGILRE